MRQIHLEKDQQLMMTERPAKSQKTEHPPITFSLKDARGVSQPHDIALVVTLVVSNYITHRIFIDNGSSVDILYLPTFIKWASGKTS